MRRLLSILKTQRQAWLLAAIVGLTACTDPSGQEAPAGPVTTSATSTADSPSTTTASPSTTVAATSHECLRPTSDCFVRGWPSTSYNPAGLYSWDGRNCAGAYCTMGFMHNGYGSGDVGVTIRLGGHASSRGSATAVTIGGHDAVYRRLDSEQEEWIVDVDGTRVFIRLVTQPDTSQADLDEAHAVIDSIRTESRDTTLGFRLVFTFETDDWDSG